MPVRPCHCIPTRHARHQLRFSSSEANPKSEAKTDDKSIRTDKELDDDPELGPLARKLQEATEETLLTGGRAGRRAIEDAGFSEELKEKLFNKISDEKFRAKYSSAFAEAGVTPSATSSAIPPSAPWTGEESTADAVLRMLDDAKKPLKPELRGKFQTPVVDPRIKRSAAQSPGQKVASARDRASMYAGMGLNKKGLSDEEKEEMKREFRERFQPHARAATITGIAQLANERIENAIARGQFKNIPRGRAQERDPRADNPFIDTTEYIMNKMIQRQDLVPPWIEKQQDLTKAANSFRSRLRNDWKRHAARMIASKGGDLLEQIHRAEQYAASEALHNPTKKTSDQISVPSSATDDPVMNSAREDVKVDTVPSGPLPRPFRDADWEKAEDKYLKLSIENLNSMTRSYNLMAPDLAKKPYFSLERELAACYAAVAPLLAGEIKERATRPASKGLGSHQTGASAMLEGVLGGGDVKIHLEREEKAYGMKEWWRDFWKK